MSAWLEHDEFRAMRARYHRALAVSVGAHALLGLGLLLAHAARPVQPRIVEVTWLDPAPPSEMPAAPARVTPAPTVTPAPRERVVTTPTAARERTRAARGNDDDDQRVAAAARRERQLAELAATRPVLGAEPGPASAATRALLATAPVSATELTRLAAATMAPVAPVADKGRPVALARGPETRGAALALTRGPAVAGSALGAAAGTLGGGLGGGLGAGFGNGVGPGAGGGGAEPGGANAAAAPRGAGPGAGDILLEGPASERPVVASALPPYPDWARRQAVEAAVTLHFTVLPDGRVREDVQVLRTAGFRDFDERAAAALRQWRFAALPGGDTAGQWGTITFRFRLRG